MIRHIQSCGIVKILLKHFQRYLGIFRDITGAQLVERGRRPSLSLFECQKNADCVHLSVKFSILNVTFYE